MWICMLLSKTSWTTCSEEWDSQDSDEITQLDYTPSVTPLILLPEQRE